MHSYRRDVPGRVPHSFAFFANEWVLRSHIQHDQTTKPYLPDFAEVSISRRSIALIRDW